MDSVDTIQKFRSALPFVRKWIDVLLEENNKSAIPVINLGFPNLKIVYPDNLLTKAKVVIIKEKLPLPPFSSIGFTEFAEMENMPLMGITYKDTFFVGHNYKTNESLHFHELVHVVQWERLGVDNFLIAYGMGIIQFGYRDSPLEQMAYDLQKNFDNGMLNENLIELIQFKTDEIWNNVVTLFPNISI